MHRFYKIVLVMMLFGCWLTAAGCTSQEDTFQLMDPEQVQDAGYETVQSGASSETGEAPVEASVTDHGDSDATAEEWVYVFVCGQVNRPDVYCLKAGSRVCDAIGMAGGCLDTADVCAVNQARCLTDGEQIYIPAIGETVARTQTDTEQTSEDHLVHLNQATKEELMTLTGIGEAKAEEILAYREAHGGFSTKEELMNITGIKAGVFEMIQNDITVE